MAKNEFNLDETDFSLSQSVYHSLSENPQAYPIFYNNLERVESLRYYDSICPRFPNEPTRDKFAIVKSTAYGEGVISLVHFNPGDVVFTFAGSILSYQTLFTLQIEEGKYIEDPIVMGKILHSCDPNMHCSMSSLTFTAIKTIKPYDFLFMDYETTEDELFRQFDCSCGSDSCRGRIRGKKFVKNDP